VARNFIDEYHLQESRNSKNYFGIFSEEELLGVVSFSLHHRNFYKLTLDRLCFKAGVRIIGGASKLIEHSKNWIKNQGFSEVVTWSDNRWSEGKVYESCGFTFDGLIGPDYSYID